MSQLKKSESTQDQSFPITKTQLFVIVIVTLLVGISLPFIFSWLKQIYFPVKNDNLIEEKSKDSYDYFLEEIADGNTGNLNGFSSGSATGTITLDLIGDFDLHSFILWNDINVLAEGIKDFRLDFFTSSDSFITSSNVFVGPLGQFEGEEYIFDDVVSNVSKVDLVVLSSYPGFGSDIEIREVAFMGEEVDTVSVPEPSSMISLLILGTVNLGYVLKRKILG